MTESVYLSIFILELNLVGVVERVCGCGVEVDGCVNQWK